ncbi:hypothetical protein ACPXCX_52345, partial [Streptomyces sp. DT225]
MADGQLTDAYRCGQLYAALAALERLGSSNGKVALDDKDVRSKAAENPRGTLPNYLKQAVAYLMAAQHRRKGAEAATVFRAIPDLLPRTKELPGSLSYAQRDDFYMG